MNGLEKEFGLKGKRVKIVKGEHEGKTGVVLEETGYTEGYGVVCKIKLDDGKEVEYSHDFFEIVDFEKWFEENIDNITNAFMDANNKEPTDEELREFAYALWIEKNREKKEETVWYENEFTIDGKKMIAFLDAIGALVDETKIKITNDGWEAKTVDPAHVGLIHFLLKDCEFEEYNIEQEIEIAVDILKILNFLKLVDYKQLHIKITPLTLTMASNGISRGFTLLDVSEYPDTKIPDMSYTAKAKLSKEETDKFFRALKIADSITQGVKIKIEDEKLIVFTGEDEGNLRAEICTTAEGEGESGYPVDYLLDMAKKIELVMMAFEEGECTIEFAKDYPIKISCGDMYYMLAPRIEVED